MASASMLTQTVTDGVVENNTASRLKGQKEAGDNSMGKEEFLKLLVAEMQYQDPLEPQSNTDYVAQLATFSQVEASENMVASMEQAEANALVGQEVIIKNVSSTTGEVSYVQGIVDFVQRDGSDIQLSIAGSLYDLDDLYSVVDSGYMNACRNADDFLDMVSQLPDESKLDLSWETAVGQVREFYDGLSDYDKQFIDQDQFSKFLQLEVKMRELRALADYVAAQAESEETGTDETEDATENIGETSGTDAATDGTTEA